jgi:hypothetical protein
MRVMRRSREQSRSATAQREALLDEKRSVWGGEWRQSSGYIVIGFSIAWRRPF